ncbi:hypothetical protein [Carbonactinospora thermoautotrophica]|uniref:hypothetical protein n=1 Tax=Carbonactinospora thermoautotrophica TaxID=1469144 RepID=UPI003DA8D096
MQPTADARDVAVFGAVNAWHQARPDLLNALPWETFGFLDVRLPGVLHERARQGNLVEDIGDFRAGERRVWQAVHALRMLVWCGITELDLLLAAFQLPWCDPALGGCRALAAERPVVRDWADAVLLATMSAEPRPGQDEDGAWASYLHHVRGMPAQVRALVVASRYADVAAGGHQPVETARRFARLAAGLDVLAADLPALRERAAVPPMQLPPVPPAQAGGPGPRPCTDADTAVALARNAAPWVDENVMVEEHDVGFLVYYPRPPPDPAAPLPVPGGTPAPGGRQSAVIVDRETGAATEFWEFTAHHALDQYRVRHRLFPLPLSEQGRYGTLLRYGLHQDLAGLGPALGRFDLDPACQQIQQAYESGLRHGGDWAAVVEAWRVGLEAVRTLVAYGFTGHEVLSAALVIAGTGVVRWQEDYLAPRTRELVAAARPPTPAFIPEFAEYVERLEAAPVETRVLATAVALARAAHARARYRVGSIARYRELEQLQLVLTDVPDLRREVFEWLVRNHPKTWGRDT